MSAYRDVILQQRERREQAMRRPSSNIIRPTHHRKFSADLSLANQGKGSQAHSNHRPTPSPNEISPTLSSNPPRRRTSLSQQSSTQFSQAPVPGQHLSFVSSPTISSNIPTMTFSPVNTADYPPISGQDSGSVPQSGTPNNILSDQSPFPSESPHPDAYNLQNSLDRGLEATLPLLAYDDSSAGEEQIEFDTLWAWPTNGTMLDGERMSGLTQGFADQSIPLFGVMDG